MGLRHLPARAYHFDYFRTIVRLAYRRALQDGADVYIGKDGVFVNGALNVPGAPQNTDTVPAKFSAKNDADDKLITVAYTFKQLTDEQRRAIYDAVKGHQTTGAGTGGSSYDVGAELPPSVDLAPFPPEVTAAIPQTEKYRYTVSGNRVLLVSPTNMIVVGVIEG